MTIKTEATRAVNTSAVFGTVLVAVFVSNLDLFVVNVAMPEIARDFGGTSLVTLSWLLNAYAIAFAALLVVFGRLADRSGHRRGFIAGIVVFTVGSLLCAVAPSVAFLIAARVVQAAGAAALLPTSLALLLAVTPLERRAGAVRAWSASGGVAAALGPVVGGLLVELDWRWIFVINVPVGVAALLMSRRVLPEIRGEKTGVRPDLLGAALLTVAVGTLALGLVRSNDWGWTSPQVVGSFAVTLVLGTWFLIRSARHPSPVVELPLLRTPQFGPATIAMLLFSVAFSAMVLSVALWAQNGWGYSALRAGLALAPGPLMVPLLAIAAGPLVRRFGAGPIAAVGNVALAGGLALWILNVGQTPRYAADLLPGLILVGIGVGLALPTLMAVGSSALPPDRLATGSGILNTGRQVGAVVGVALLVSVIGSPHTRAETVDAFQSGWTATIVVCLLGAVTALFIRRPQQ
ncbi:DHA2 family efflux MFS transporter permease subunit [Actinoplanes sp. NBRC 103695]|uniref:DHA2 family efflux MFS transporter permease subunit n=1 Tax=Actinoplanes sp. NBRC 103695 TaxID=3032202 RepID=UPI0024A49FB2|nr:DHA2 family efflux MFS transporter permease subunit [Actinoplanes sp. NBRC 103695]GLY97290.1 MFS transporter [Actinoplanes sp. NBRC 103695]